jgi:DNA-binding sugar fermentation-stimulating protein
MAWVYFVNYHGAQNVVIHSGVYNRLFEKFISTYDLRLLYNCRYNIACNNQESKFYNKYSDLLMPSNYNFRVVCQLTGAFPVIVCLNLYDVFFNFLII